MRLHFCFEVINMRILKIDPIQPYFVLNTRAYHKLMSVDSPIAHFYQFTYTENNPVINGVVPDGAIDMIFDINSETANLSGSVLQTAKTVFKHGHTYFGARFKPGTFENYGDIKASELVGISVPLTDVICLEYLNDIFSDMDITQRAEIILQKFKSGDNVPTLVNNILSMIYNSSGNITVNEIENELFYSRRHLTRVFGAYIGMDIKSFCRIARFQSVLSDLNLEKHTLLTDIAQNHGYYDQTHFQKDFKRFALITPKLYVKTLEENAYQKRIKRF